MVVGVVAVALQVVAVLIVGAFVSLLVSCLIG